MIDSKAQPSLGRSWDPHALLRRGRTHIADWKCRVSTKVLAERVAGQSQSLESESSHRRCFALTLKLPNCVEPIVLGGASLASAGGGVDGAGADAMRFSSPGWPSPSQPLSPLGPSTALSQFFFWLQPLPPSGSRRSVLAAMNPAIAMGFDSAERIHAPWRPNSQTKLQLSPLQIPISISQSRPTSFCRA